MSLILSIETSTPVCSVAIHKNGNILGLSEFFEDKSHSKVLNHQIEFLLKNIGLDLNDLDAIAVSKGPGSYTGLRIGVATAKGFCYATDKPLLAVSTLQAMALRVNKTNLSGFDLCPMLDARRMEVYCCLFNTSLEYIQPVQAKVLDEHSFHGELSQNKILFFGSGSEKAEALFSSHENACFTKGIYPSAAEIGVLAQDQFQEGMIEDTAYFEPYYLKEFVTTQKNKHGN